MILYLDTSALVKLYASEPKTKDVQSAVGQLKRDFREVYLLRRLTRGIFAHAGELAREHALRAYDAVHLATALALREDSRELSARQEEESAEEAATQESDEARVLLMSYDSSLLQAARKEALAYESEFSPARGEEESP